MSRYDSIIIGAGHNGLVCAAYLARSGQSVLLLESANRTGGLAATREFHPGFRASVAHSVSHFSSHIADDLDLSSHGFEFGDSPLTTVGLCHEQRHVYVLPDKVTGVGNADQSAYQEYQRRMKRFADALQPFWLKTMPRIGSKSLPDIKTFAHLGLNIRRLGREHMRELLRIASLPARDLMDENFESDLLKAVLSWDGMIGARLAPRSPNSAVLAMLYRQSGRFAGAHSLPPGGINTLIGALERTATASGVTIRCEAPVERILMGAGETGQFASGVQLENGETLEADRIIAATDPQRTFLDLVGVQYLDIEFSNRIRRLRCQGYVAKLHLALDGLPEFSGVAIPDARMIIAPDLDAIEFAFDDAKYGECPGSLVMEIIIPSLHAGALAPDGQHVLSAHVMYVPYQRRGGWTDAAREKVCDLAVETIARYAPGIRQQILHREFLTPADLEHSHHVTGGHWHHTEFAMDQLLMMRPTYGAAQYTTPIPGLYLCGAGCHPGGDITGAPGHNAALAILR